MHATGHNLPRSNERTIPAPHMTGRLLPLVALLTTISVHGQIAFGGQPYGMRPTEKTGLPPAPRVIMPTVDAAALMAEDAERAAQGIKGPYRFGFNHATDLSLDNSGIWHTMPNGDRVWRLAIVCPNAFSINFEFNEYMVPEGARVFVYNAWNEVLGGFTAASNGGRPTMGVGQLAGDRITVEYVEPASVEGQGHLRIGQVTHAYRDVLGLAKGLGDSGSCNNNVICPVGDEWRDEIRSVAIIIVGGSGYCTGTLLNNCAEDGTPYFLTANHCTEGANVNNWVFRFNWESPVCEANQNGPTNQTVSGASLLENSGGSDVALLQLNSTPPSDYNVYYAGWDNSGAAPTSEVCIHHPSGDIKKISFNNDAAGEADWGSAATWHIPAWDDGTTEPGSSGSGLWNQDHRIIGQLFGGQASCSNNVNDYFGRFDVSWPLLESHLGSCGTTLDGWDPAGSTTYQYDALLQSINNVPPSLCNENTIDPTITIKNNGTETLTSLSIAWSVTGGGSGNADWSGSLATGATAIHPLPSITLPNGGSTLTVTATLPNGQTDENPSGNTRTKDIMVASPGVETILNITLDNYGSETTWQLATNTGTVVATGGPYADFSPGTESITLCLAVGCYDLTVSDEYEDGICCEYGNGHFEVVDADGVVLASNNGQFLASATEEFCVDATGLAPLGDDVIRVAPNPADERLSILLPASLTGGTLALYDAMGRIVLNRRIIGTDRLDLDLSGHAEGVYLLEGIAPGIRIQQRLVIAH